MNIDRLFYCKAPNIRALHLLIVSFYLLSGALLAGCGRNTPTPAFVPTTPSTESVSTQAITEIPTIQEPSATPAPLAVRVNQGGVTLVEYQAELERFKQAAGREIDEADRQVVLDELINQTLLAQAAIESGFTLDEAGLQARIDQLVDQTGGAAALSEWMQANGYSEADFRQGLARGISAAWMRDQIISKVPETAEQVHARQILLRTTDEANQALARLQAGEKFETLAKEADPIAAGELGWFPRGYLFFPALDEAVFKLEPGQYSGVIETTSGFHILYVVERDPAYPLASQPRLILQEKALMDWLAQAREQAQIEIVTP